MTTISYKQTPEFEKDFRRLAKKYRGLEDDLEVAKKAAIELYHIRKLDNHAIEPMPGFCTTELLLCKLKKFTCRALKGKGVQSGIRIIYSFDLVTQCVSFIEIYYKGEQANEDKDRIKSFLKDWKLIS